MEQKWYIHRISFRILFPVISGIVLYLALLMVFGNLADISESFFSQEALFLVILAYLNHEWAILLLGRGRSRQVLGSPGSVGRILYFGILLITSIGISSVVTLAYFIFILGYYHFITELVAINALMVIFQLLVHLYYLSMLNIRRSHELILEKEEALGRQVELELENFKAEMNPGLLMECLENLLTLIRLDVRESDRYIRSLSNQYRYLLDMRQREFVGLPEEIRAAGELVYLINGGGEAKIVLDHHVKESHTNVLPGSLHQIIYHLENSMILNPLDPLRLELAENEDGSVRIRHPKRLKINPPEGYPLDKLNRSYRHYTGSEITVSDDGSWMEWSVPRLPEIIENE